MPCHMGALPIPPHSLRDPATNNAPLVFNTNKGKPPMPISLNDDSDYRKILGKHLTIAFKIYAIGSSKLQYYFLLVLT